MYIKKIAGVSLIALGSISSLMAEIDTALSVEGPNILIGKIQDQRKAVKVSEDQFKQLVGRLIKKGTLVSIGELVEHKTDEYTNAWAEIQALHAAYEAAKSGFASGKDEPAAIQALRVKLADKQAEYGALEDEDGSASLDANPNTGKLKGKISVLEGENEDLYEALAAYSKMDRVTKGKIKGLQGKAKRAKGEAADRYASLVQSQEDLLSQNSVNIQKAQEQIKKNKVEIQNLKTESEEGSFVSARAKGLRDKRFAKQLVQKEIKRIKADLKTEIKAHSTDRVNKKTVNKALSEVVVAYTQFVQKFVDAGRGAQSCLDQCTKMLLKKTEKTLVKPEGTCTAGGLPPVVDKGGAFDQDDRDFVASSGHTSASFDAQLERTEDLFDDSSISTSHDMDGIDVDSPVLQVEKPKAAPAIEAPESTLLNATEKALIAQISKLIHASKNTKRAHKRQLLGTINIAKNCSTIKALAKNTSLTSEEEGDLNAFLTKYGNGCSR